VSTTLDPLVGGAVTDYNYVVDGRVDTLTVPSSTFNPITASSTVLSELGLPPRPSQTDAASYDQWLSQYGSLSASSWVSPPPCEVIDTSAPAADTTSAIWVGDFDTGQKLTQSGAVWPEPTAHSSHCSNDAIYTWGGLGGINENKLEQGGTAYGVSGIGLDQGWTEFLPDQPSPVVRDVFATPGEDMSVDMSYEVADRQNVFDWTLWNIYLNEVVSGSYVPSTYSLATAEAIIERPGVYNLLNFGTVQFLASDSSNFGSSGAYGSPTLLDMYDGHYMATAQDYAIYSGDSTWNDAQDDCN
jgi:hypothetical protein